MSGYPGAKRLGSHGTLCSAPSSDKVCIIELCALFSQAAVNSVLPEDNGTSSSVNLPPLPAVYVYIETVSYHACLTECCRACLSKFVWSCFRRGEVVDLTSSNSSASHSHFVDLTRDPLPPYRPPPVK